MSATKAQGRSSATPGPGGQANVRATVNENSKINEKSTAAPKVSNAHSQEPGEVDKQIWRYATTTSIIRMESASSALLAVPHLTPELLAGILDSADAETDRDFNAIKKIEGDVRASQGKVGAAAAGRSQFHAVVEHMAQNLGKIWREEAVRTTQRRDENQAPAPPPPAADEFIPPPPPPRASVMRGRAGNSHFGDDSSGSDVDSDYGDLPPLEHVDLSSDDASNDDNDVDDNPPDKL